MLQDFRRRTTPETGAPRVAALRAAMAEAGVDAFLVPRADAHQGENVAALSAATRGAPVSGVVRRRKSCSIGRSLQASLRLAVNDG